MGRLIVQHTSNTITCSHSFILHSVYEKKIYIRILTYPLQFDMFMTYIYECSTIIPYIIVCVCVCVCVWVCVCACVCVYLCLCDGE